MAFINYYYTTSIFKHCIINEYVSDLLSALTMPDLSMKGIL